MSHDELIPPEAVVRETHTVSDHGQWEPLAAWCDDCQAVHYENDPSRPECPVCSR